MSAACAQEPHRSIYACTEPNAEDKAPVCGQVVDLSR